MLTKKIKKKKKFAKENEDRDREIWKWSVIFCLEKQPLFGYLFWENKSSKLSWSRLKRFTANTYKMIMKCQFVVAMKML